MHIHDAQPVYRTGAKVTDADAALVLVHGRGATAHSILTLADELAQPGFAYLAPQAAGNTWYPFSFLAPMDDNEPHLSSALAKLSAVVTELEEAGIPPARIVLGGFSQGACLASEWVARHARRYGGLLVFSGGLIGPPGTPREYMGALDGTPVFIGCSDIDSHIPVGRVHETTAVLRELGGVVDERIYPQMAHTVVEDELRAARQLLAGVVGASGDHSA